MGSRVEQGGVGGAVQLWLGLQHCPGLLGSRVGEDFKGPVVGSPGQG